MSEPDLVSAHAFYHDDLDNPIVHVVAPLVDELATRGLATDYFFLRYWEGGTHVRLRVLPAEPVFRGTVENLISERFRDYFTHRPAAAQIRSDEYSEMAGLLASWEEVPNYIENLRPCITA